MTTKPELLQKLKNLTKSSNISEALQAQRMLEKLMKKYGINEDDLNESLKKKFVINFKNKTEFQLFTQIYGITLGTDTVSYSRVSKKYTFVLEPDFWIEIKAKYDFYLQKFYDELEVYYLAFLDANNLYTNASPSSVQTITEEELKQRKKAKLMANAMDHHQFYKQLEARMHE